MPPDPAAPSPIANWPQSSERLADALAAYVSPLVLGQIGRDGVAVNESRQVEFEGVIVVIDIAGSTTLTERLEQAGQSGVEEVSRLLIAYFTELIELIGAHGGLVEKFAGDALIAVWSAPAAPLAETAHRAAQCALRIQEELGEYRMDGDVSLFVRIGMGAGRVRHMVLGGVEDRWLSRLAGEALASARAAIALAQPREVMQGPDFARVLRGAGGDPVLLTSVPPIRVQAVRPPPVTGVAVAALSPHLPAAVREQITAGRASWLAEFRRLTVLFIHVAEIDEGGPEGLAAAHSVVRQIQAVLQRYDGVVDNLGDDHEGITLVAALGLPAWTHEDDAVRALRIALDVRRELRDLGFVPAIGVTTGRVFCGAIGSARRRAYSMVGDTMNRCARLMARAENDILCDEPTRRAAARHIRLEALGSVALRGKASAVAIFRPLGEEHTAAAQVSGIVGRRPEREILRERLTALHERGAGGVVVIEGEAGIGKSTLVSACTQMASEIGVRLLTGGGDSLERTGSYHAWRRVFREALDLPPDADDTARRALFFQRFEPESETARLAPVLNPVLSLHLAENEITSQMTAQSRAEAATALLVQILHEAAAQTPLAVVLEDAHWLDSASWSLALELHRKIPRLLLVIATRPLELPEPEPWKPLRQAAGRAYLALGPLAGEDVLALVCTRLKVNALPAAVAELILEKAEGHPFFSEELGYSLRDAGHLVIRERHCALAPSAGDLRSLRFPTNVQGVVSERIDRLSPRERFAIKVASVNGRAFSLRTLQAIHPVEEDHEYLPACLDRLVELNLAVRSEVPGEALFLFKHNIIQEVAYQQLVFAHRQPLHQRLAEYLEKSEPANFPLLAHHWRHAEVPEKAVHYFDLAGDEAARRYANREVIEFFAQAIDLGRASSPVASPPQAGHRHRQVGEAHYRLGRLDEGRRWLSQASAILGYPMPALRRMKMLALPAAALRQMILRCRTPAGGPSPAAPVEPLLEAIQIYNLLGEIAFFTNDLPTSVFCTIYGANLAESLGPSDKLTEMYGAMMIVAAALPWPAFARHYRNLAERTLGSVQHPMTQAYVEELLGMYFGGLGHFERARALLGKAHATFRRFGNSRRSEECLTNLGYAHFHGGDFGQSASTGAELIRSADGREDAQTRGWARTQRASLLLATDGPAAALAELDERDFLVGDPLTRAAFDAVCGNAQFRLHGVEAARARAENALAHYGGALPVSYTMAHFLSHMAEVFLGFLEHAQRAASPTGAAAAQARQACAALTRFARVFPVARPRAALWTGLEHWLHGRRHAAERQWNAARTAAEERGMPFDLALVHVQLARLHAVPHRAEALALFQKLGAQSELAHWFPNA